jgi:hypothetical protein
MPQLSCIDCEEPIPAGQPPVVVEWGKPPDIPILGRPIARARCLRCEDKRRGKSGAGAVTGAAAALEEGEG